MKQHSHSILLDQACSECLIHSCHLGIFLSCIRSHLYLPVTDHEAPLSQKFPAISLPCFSLALPLFYLFILSLQCCLACFALLFHPISSFRSFYQNPYCLFHNLSIFPSLSLMHICLPSYVPWYFYEAFIHELQKCCSRSTPEGAAGGRGGFLCWEGGGSGPHSWEPVESQPSWEIG